MKTTVADYRYRCYCLRITPRYGAGTVVRFTDFPRDLTMGNGQIYKADTGYEFTGMTAGTGAASAVIDLEGAFAAAGVTRDALVSGVYDNAKVNLFATNWTNPIEDEEALGFGFLGKTTIRDSRWVAEIMTGQDALTQSVGASYTPNCPKTFGGTEYGGCQKTLGPITVTGTITSVSSRYALADSSRAEAADYFTAGLLELTSGANAGLKAQEIKAHSGGGNFALFEAFPYPVAPGDTYSLIPGCRKRLADCIAWGNVPRFGGFPYVPTVSTYSKFGTGAA